MHLQRALALVPLSGLQLPPSSFGQTSLATYNQQPTQTTDNLVMDLPGYSPQQVEALERRLQAFEVNEEDIQEVELEEGVHDFEALPISTEQWDPRSMRHLLQNTANKICKSLGSGLTTASKICDKSVRFPTGATVRSCTRRVSVVDDCATRKSFQYPCSRGICTGWTCVPGTVMKDVSYPCGLDVKYRNAQACNANIRKLAVRAEGICSCTTTIQSFLSGTDGQLAQADSPDVATSRALSAYAKYTACLVDAGFQVKRNRNLALKNLQSTSDVTFIVLPDIQLSQYIDLFERVAACVDLGLCDQIILFFTQYLKDAQKAITDGYQSVVETWLQPLMNLQNAVLVAQQKLEAITQQDSSDLMMCTYVVDPPTGVQVYTRFNELKVFFKSGGEVLELVQAVGTASEAISTITDEISALLSGLSGNTISQIQSLVRNGGNLNDILKSILYLRSFEKTISSLQNVGTLIPNLLSFIEERANQLPDVPCGSQDALSEAIAAVKKVKELTQQIRFRGIQVDAGIQSYNRWVDVSATLPCSRSQRKCFKIADQSRCVSYPEIYSCTDRKRVFFPNEHIPFLKFSFV